MRVTDWEPMEALPCSLCRLMPARNCVHSEVARPEDHYRAGAERATPIPRLPRPRQRPTVPRTSARASPASCKAGRALKMPTMPSRAVDRRLSTDLPTARTRCSIDAVSRPGRRHDEFATISGGVDHADPEALASGCRARSCTAPTRAAIRCRPRPPSSGAARWSRCGAGCSRPAASAAAAGCRSRAGYRQTGGWLEPRRVRFHDHDRSARLAAGHRPPDP